MDNNTNMGPTYIFYNDRDIINNYQPSIDSKLEGEHKNLVDVINLLMMRIEELENKNK
jgi:hypothetical protein